MNTILVSKIAASDLPSLMTFALKHVYQVELKDFVVMYNNKFNILYVNNKIPVKDIRKFMLVVGYEGKYINDINSGIGTAANYIAKNYGESTWRILFDFYKERIKREESAKAQEKAAGVYQIIQEYEADDDLPDIVCNREYLIYHLAHKAMGENRKTYNKVIGYADKIVFLYGYLVGKGILVENEKEEQSEKESIFYMLVRLLLRMDTKQVKRIFNFANNLYVGRGAYGEN